MLTTISESATATADELELDPLKVSIARISEEELDEMNRADLARMIRLSGVFASQDWIDCAECLDHTDLDRLAMLSRRRCREDINAVYERHGKRVPFVNG
jgi:hypothetical protein